MAVEQSIAELLEDITNYELNVFGEEYRIDVEVGIVSVLVGDNYMYCTPLWDVIMMII